LGLGERQVGAHLTRIGSNADCEILVSHLRTSTSLIFNTPRQMNGPMKKGLKTALAVVAPAGAILLMTVVAVALHDPGAPRAQNRVQQHSVRPAYCAGSGTYRLPECGLTEKQALEVEAASVRKKQEQDYRALMGCLNFSYRGVHPYSDESCLDDADRRYQAGH
jgi:hypothetical protein